MGLPLIPRGHTDRDLDGWTSRSYYVLACDQRKATLWKLAKSTPLHSTGDLRVRETNAEAMKMAESSCARLKKIVTPPHGMPSLWHASSLS